MALMVIALEGGGVHESEAAKGQYEAAGTNAYINGFAAVLGVYVFGVQANLPYIVTWTFGTLLTLPHL